MSESFLDLWVAGGLVVISLLLFFLSQIGLLPRKTLPYVAGVLAGGLGLVIFKSWRQRGMSQELERRKAEVDRLHKQVDTVRQTYAVTEREVAAERARLNDQIAALAKDNRELEAKLKTYAGAVQGMSRTQTQDEFDLQFGGRQ